MDYWAEAMQDDAWMIADGWQALRVDGTLKGQPNTDLDPGPRWWWHAALPPSRRKVEQLEAERDAISRQIEELEEAWRR